MEALASNTCRICAPSELNTSTVGAFRNDTHLNLTDEVKVLEVDLRNTSFMDSTGLGALISFNKKMTQRGGAVRLLNPAPPVQQILELTRLHKIFEISHD